MDRKEARLKAQELVARMTIEEKASQLKFDAEAIPRLDIPAYNWWNEALHGVARAGTATVFPQAIALGAAFDTELMERSEAALRLRDARNITKAKNTATGIFIRDLPSGLQMSIFSGIQDGDAGMRPTEKIHILHQGWPFPLSGGCREMGNI